MIGRMSRLNLTGSAAGSSMPNNPMVTAHVRCWRDGSPPARTVRNSIAFIVRLFWSDQFHLSYRSAT
jgi:hypothetical protein